MADIDRTELINAVRMIEETLEVVERAGAALVAAHLSTALDCANAALVDASNDPGHS